MWKFKPFSGKEPAGLENRAIDVGSVRVQVQNAVAEGGFSCVYLARDAAALSRQYALKHIICPDAESLDLAATEISVMRLLKGHPNVVALVAHAVLEVGRRKEALLLMEFCEKSLVKVLDSRGAAGFFDEKQVLLIFRDVCNAVFAMHSQSPPIAHRDLKVENVLLGSDGAWKLCDFGSTSTNHKRFDRPEEMGIEEDNIRKYTTPAYRAPEMWDLYRRDFISEKVDIWALGCLLYRICYFKLAFDGESKLQILNGNYRIPDVPEYSDSMTSLIKDMLEPSPDSRPDITQKDLPDGSASASAVDKPSPASSSPDEGAQRKSPVMPRRSPPPPPSSREQQSRPVHGTSKVSSAGSSMGAFWSTQHAQDSHIVEDKGPIFDDELPIGQTTSKIDSTNTGRRKSVHESTIKGLNNDSNGDFEISFSPEKKPETNLTFHDEAFNKFVADFSNAGSASKSCKSEREENLETEVCRLRELLKQANLEKAEITSKYEKLSAICRSQRQELQELKRSLPATPSPPSNKASPKTPETPQGTFDSSPSGSDSSTWQAFADEPKQQTTTSPTPRTINPRSVRTANGQRNSAKSSPTSDQWGFGQESFKAAPSPGSATSRSPAQGSTSQRLGGSKAKKAETSNPAGWAGF